jgi:hypothetical protein
MTAVILHRVCAWCQRVIEQGTPGARTTHVLCPACVEKMLHEVA